MVKLIVYEVISFTNDEVGMTEPSVSVPVNGVIVVEMVSMG